MPPNVLSARMARYYYEVFYPAGISMRSKRTAKERLHILECHPEDAPDPNADKTDGSLPACAGSDWDSSVAEAKQILRQGR